MLIKRVEETEVERTPGYARQAVRGAVNSVKNLASTVHTLVIDIPTTGVAIARNPAARELIYNTSRELAHAVWEAPVECALIAATVVTIVPLALVYNRCNELHSRFKERPVELISELATSFFLHRLISKTATAAGNKILGRTSADEVAAGVDVSAPPIIPPVPVAPLAENAHEIAEAMFPQAVGALDTLTSPTIYSVTKSGWTISLSSISTALETLRSTASLDTLPTIFMINQKILEATKWYNMALEATSSKDFKKYMGRFDHCIKFILDQVRGGAFNLAKDGHAQELDAYNVFTAEIAKNILAGAIAESAKPPAHMTFDEFLDIVISICIPAAAAESVSRSSGVSQDAPQPPAREPEAEEPGPVPAPRPSEAGSALSRLREQHSADGPSRPVSQTLSPARKMYLASMGVHWAHANPAQAVGAPAQVNVRIFRQHHLAQAHAEVVTPPPFQRRKTNRQIHTILMRKGIFSSNEARQSSWQDTFNHDRRSYQQIHAGEIARSLS